MIISKLFSRIALFALVALATSANPDDLSKATALAQEEDQDHGKLYGGTFAEYLCLTAGIYCSHCSCCGDRRLSTSANPDDLSKTTTLAQEEDQDHCKLCGSNWWEFMCLTTGTYYQQHCTCCGDHRLSMLRFLNAAEVDSEPEE
jgi:hypothetical protein